MNENELNVITPLNSVQDAIDYVQAHLKTGVTCPCCKQHAEIHNRALTSAMALVLQVIYSCPMDRYVDGYLHVENYLKTLNVPASARGDFPKLRFWELIENKPGEKPDSPTRNGFYRITTKGENFIEGMIVVAKQISVYNNKCLSFSAETISFEQALKDSKFNINDIKTVLA